MRSVFQWNLGGRALELGKRTLIMGIVNVTPDSFSDGGQFLDRDEAIAHAARLLDEGADIVDIGGESTRPGARVAPSVSKPAAGKPDPGANLRVGSLAVSAEEELKRILPVIAELKKKHPAAVLSVDTYKADVARAAVGAGAEIVNDVSGFRWDARMAKTVAELKLGLDLARASTRTIRCWGGSVNCKRRASLCWRALHASRLLAGLSGATARMFPPRLAFMERLRLRLR